MEKDKECVSYAFLPVAIIKTLTCAVLGRKGLVWLIFSSGHELRQEPGEMREVELAGSLTVSKLSSTAFSYNNQGLIPSDDELAKP